MKSMAANKTRLPASTACAVAMHRVPLHAMRLCGMRPLLGMPSGCTDAPIAAHAMMRRRRSH